MNIAGIEFVQMGIVVRDLDAAIERFDHAAGKGEWTVYALGSDAFSARTYRGRAARFTLRHAMSWRAEDQWELCEPGPEPSVWREHLDAGRDGVQHLGAYVESIAEETARLEALGWSVVQIGRGFGAGGDGEFRYYEHPEVPWMLELISAPVDRRQPQRVIAKDRR